LDAIAHLPSGWAALFWGVLTFSVLVVIHEGGHFLTARLFGVKVHEFMLGLPGPALRFRSKRSGTRYGVTALPLGGYVRIAGMEPGEEDDLLGPALEILVRRDRTEEAELAAMLSVTRERAGAILATLADWGAIEAAEDGHGWVPTVDAPADLSANELLDRARSVTYRGKRTWQRVVILLTGVAFNFLAAILIFTVTLSAWGYEVPSLTLTTVVKGSAAATAGIRTGDRVVSFAGRPLSQWSDLLDSIGQRRPGERVSVGFTRDGRRSTVSVVLGGTGSRALLGVGAGLERQRFSVLGALRESLVWTGMVFVAIGQFFNPSTFAASVANARSVVGISYEVARAAQAGPIEYAWMIALLSLSLGALNILPIPPLDGGKVAVELIERIRRRPLRRELSYAVSALGAVLLFSLIFYLMYADIMRYVVKG
jgi:regulator of sigma E protease